ncbi:MAG: hypothetical protein AAF892_12160 [Cyanobacteria bacterium P01_D01_bin.71]
MHRRSLGWLGVAAIALILSLFFGSGGRLTQPAPSSATVLTTQAPADEDSELTAAAPAFSGTYEDPQGSFQIGILDGATTTTAGSAPLFVTADSSLAYSVVTLPLESEAPLTDIALVELTRQTLDYGEGFQTQTFTSVPEGLQIAWTGRLSQSAGPPQPVSGSVLARQQGAAVYLLVVAALESATAQVPQVLVALADSLEFL